MGNIIDFNSKTGSIEYDCILKADPYLRSTALNALQLASYSISRFGVLEFEKDNGFKEDGILSIDHLAVLISYYDPDTRQEIINYLERTKTMKTDNNKGTGAIIITLLFLLFFELYGIVSCFLDIVNLIKG